jgi:hypothetical protein
MYSALVSRITSCVRSLSLRPMMEGSCMSSRKLADAGGGNTASPPATVAPR